MPYRLSYRAETSAGPGADNGVSETMARIVVRESQSHGRRRSSASVLAVRAVQVELWTVPLSANDGCRPPRGGPRGNRRWSR